jgi:hypothetical protein
VGGETIHSSSTLQKDITSRDATPSTAVSSKPANHELPTRREAWSFALKTRLFQLHRAAREIGNRPPRHRRADALRDAPVIGEAKALLWNQTLAEEFPLTAGKVENLRIAARALHGLEIPAEQTLSFWRQLRRTTRSRGFTTGRELREGCLVPSVGGGLCQLSGLLYQAALQAHLEIVERHAHSRTLPGSAAEQGLDATVFWNYVDLRFRAPSEWRIEVQLDATSLIVRIRSGSAITEKASATRPADPDRPPASGDCLTCQQTECFRHPSATRAHAPALGHSAFLLDARWPEFDRWCGEHARDGDHWFLPLDGRRWNKPNYAWSPSARNPVHHATLPTLLRSLRQRRLPAQGAIRQNALLEADSALANYYHCRISPECRHLVVSQNLLPHLWRLGTLGGRTYDVLMTRWPLAELHRLLDAAASAHPDSPTLADFRADRALMRDESAALEQAARLVTPHRAIAASFGHRAWLIDWEIPKDHGARSHPSSPASRLFLPCSALGRKGIHELAAALRDREHELLVLGRAREAGPRDPLTAVRWKPTSLDQLNDCDALILPAWVEHQPRIALRALALGIPVIATESCGLPDHPLLKTITVPDPDAILTALDSLSSQRSDTRLPALAPVPA